MVHHISVLDNYVLFHPIFVLGDFAAVHALLQVLVRRDASALPRWLQWMNGGVNTNAIYVYVYRYIYIYMNVYVYIYITIYIYMHTDYVYLIFEHVLFEWCYCGLISLDEWFINQCKR